jgi:hypothetical protein
MLNHAQKFPSKRGFVIFIPLIILLLIEVGYIAGGRHIGAVLLLAVMSVVFLPVFFNTNYTIQSDGTLRVKCGMFFNTSVDIGSITKVEDTSNILSAPALSMDRLELFYNKFDSVVISPQDKAAFVAELQKINPGIRYNS